MTTSIVLTLVGDDRPGIVERVAAVLAEQKGNWIESSLANLAGKFAGIVRVDVPKANAAELLAQLEALKAEGLQVIAEVADTEDTGAGRAVCLELVGQDRPGIVRDITAILARHQLNVEEMETRVEEAPMSGELLFHADMMLRVPDAAELEAVQSELQDLANELMADIRLED